MPPKRRLVLAEDIEEFLRLVDAIIPSRTTLNEMRVINALHLNQLRDLPERSTVSILYKELDVARASVSRILQELVADGWVQQVPDENDRRRSHFVYSPEGRTAADRLYRELIEHGEKRYYQYLKKIHSGRILS